MVKAELNGVRVPGALTAMTLAVKLTGVTLVVASGLPCGREGPMVQVGAIVGSGEGPGVGDGVGSGVGSLEVGEGVGSLEVADARPYACADLQ